MLENIVVIALVVLAGAYLARRIVRWKAQGGCGCPGSGSGAHGGCCKELGPMPNSGGAQPGGTGCGGSCGCSRVH